MNSYRVHQHVSSGRSEQSAHCPSFAAFHRSWESRRWQCRPVACRSKSWRATNLLLIYKTENRLKKITHTTLIISIKRILDKLSLKNYVINSNPCVPSLSIYCTHWPKAFLIIINMPICLVLNFFFLNIVKFNNDLFNVFSNDSPFEKLTQAHHESLNHL